MKVRLRLLALTAALALGIAGCSGNTSNPAAPSATTPAESASSDVATSAAPSDGASPTDDAAPSEVSADVVKGLKYGDTELQVVAPEQLKSYMDAYNKQLKTMGDVKSEPAECAARGTEAARALMEKTPVMALSQSGGGAASVQVYAGAAKDVDFAKLRDIMSKCSEYTLEVNGTSVPVKVSEAKSSVSADEVLGQQVQQEIAGESQTVVTVMATKGDNLVVTSVAGPETADQAKLDELTTTVLSRL
ncbi:hypothetical protein BSZ39_07585 [Bowdeniella nasicola]|uniref:PknH-like extracellular domain-containing protein n=1 Tax=Bowdeniella nasicola TaxID=208480 RepID=A0A1Q5Q238_9ACTO|nr:hypothetical protein [Bowdeniella nasicola]OKL53779.1 hypothetical protein BSZ39_07585 [Bowdeniella nasicola]